jgi:hypothetical protein
VSLSSALLSSALQALTPTTSESVARARLTDAWEDYFLGATVSGAALVGASIGPGLSAFSAALVGMSSPSAGSAAIASACSAFWTAQLGLATGMWITAPIVLVPPIVPPAGLATLPAALAATFAANLAGQLGLAAACDALAATLHAATIGATVPGSVLPAPPAPIPIL